jgi:hypothetical protein
MDSNNNMFEGNPTDGFGVGSQPDSSTITGVSCADDNFCMAVDDQGNYMTATDGFGGFYGSIPTSFDSGHIIDSVSCPLETFCAASDDLGNVLTFDGSVWSGPTHLESTPFLLVSCASAHSCQALGQDGSAFTFDGSSWSAAGVVDAASAPTALSCPSQVFCAAVDTGGQALTYEIDQAIHFTSSPSNPQLGGTYTVSASGGGSGNDVIFTIDSSSTSGCSVSGDVVSFHSPTGSCVIDANQGSAPGYFLASQAQQVVSVSCVGLMIIHATLPTAVLRAPYSAQINGCGGTLPYKFGKAGSLPRGLKLSSHGAITGTPTRSGSFSFGVKLTDKEKPKHTVTQTFSITVEASHSIKHGRSQLKHGRHRR